MKNFINKYTISILIVTFTVLFITIYYQSSIYAPQQTITFTGKVIPLNYANSTLLNNFNKKNIDEYQTAAGTYDIQTIASEVTSTMLAAFSNSAEKTLPLVSNWNVGIPEYNDGLDPLYMINRFAYGEHLIPTWKLDPYYNNIIGLSYYETSIKRAAKLGLPLVFILPSPESALTKDDVYFSMDKAQNPNVITVNGTVLPKLSPFGPDSLWNEVGEQWSETSLMVQIQEWYPNPPLVVFVDEDASKKLSWSKLATSSKYIEHYPTNTSNEFKRTLVNAKWVEKYRQLHEGFKQGFIKTAWKQNVKFITRNQLASNMGVTSDWINRATTTHQYVNIWPLTADGLTINFNLTGYNTDATSVPFTLLNNIPFMLEEAKELNPNFTYQLSIDTNQKINNPQSYRGLTQFALWFLRPSIIRQTTNQTTKDKINPLFQQVIDSVDLVNDNEILADFWKNGKLLQIGESRLNSNIPTQYKAIPRWFLLKTNSNKLVWSFAIEKGEAPNREWLIYAESPEGNLTNVTVSLPDFSDVIIDSTREGNFYTVNETTPIKTTAIMRRQKTNSTSILDSNSTYTSPYLEKITLPQCDSSNPEVQIINTNADWKYINDVDKRIFCVKPGDYSSIGNIKLTTSGTKNKKRYIILDNGNNIHPGKLDKKDLAKVGFILQDTNYWIIDRMAYWESPTTSNPIKIINSDNNIINRYFMDNVGSGIYLYPSSNNNTIQNCRIQRENINIHFDRAAIGLFDNKELNVSITNTKIVNNEIKNFVDGIQLIRMTRDTITHIINYEGTTIDNNKIFITNEIYTDCKGNHDINGTCSYAENAIDLKAGSLNPNNSIIISNNIMWGYRKSDTVNSTLDDPGTNTVIHYDTKNLRFMHNIIFDSVMGIVAGDPLKQYALQDSTISNNIFLNLKSIGIYLNKASKIFIKNNLLKNFGPIIENNYKSNFWLLLIRSSDINFTKNDIVDSNSKYAEIENNQITTCNFSNNIYYKTRNNQILTSKDIQVQNNPAINYKDFKLIYDNFTNNPKTINLKNIIKKRF